MKSGRQTIKAFLFIIFFESKKVSIGVMQKLYMPVRDLFYKLYRLCKFKLYFILPYTDKDIIKFR